MKDMGKASEGQIEVMSGGTSKSDGLDGATKVMGMVKLTKDSIIYIPTPTADLQGTWQVARRI